MLFQFCISICDGKFILSYQYSRLIFNWINSRNTHIYRKKSKTYLTELTFSNNCRMLVVHSHCRGTSPASLYSAYQDGGSSVSGWTAVIQPSKWSVYICRLETASIYISSSKLQYILFKISIMIGNYFSYKYSEIYAPCRILSVFMNGIYSHISIHDWYFLSYLSLFRTGIPF